MCALNKQCQLHANVVGCAHNIVCIIMAMHELLLMWRAAIWKLY